MTASNGPLQQAAGRFRVPSVSACTYARAGIADAPEDR